MPEERVAVALVGADEPLFRPGWHPPEPFHALFVGKLIPLHGLETILEARALAPELQLRIVGDGQQAPCWSRGRRTSPRAVDRVRGPARGVPRRRMRPRIFGTGEKAARVIPNKVFQALACARPVITADTPAARELLTDDADALLVPPGDAEALAARSAALAGDPALAERLGEAGRETYEARASEAVLGERWRSLLEGVVRR